MQCTFLGLIAFLLGLALGRSAFVAGFFISVFCILMFCIVGLSEMLERGDTCPGCKAGPRVSGVQGTEREHWIIVEWSSVRSGVSRRAGSIA